MPFQKWTFSSFFDGISINISGYSSLIHLMGACDILYITAGKDASSVYIKQEDYSCTTLSVRLSVNI